MHLLRTSVAALTATLAFSGAASAQNLFFANLNTAQEIPAPVGPNLNGSGFAFLQVMGSSSLMVDMSASNLSTNVVGAHIHIINTPAGTGPIVLDLISAGTGTNSVFVNQLFTAAAPNRPLLSTTIAGIQANPQNYYVNVHTTQNPAGEVRGNLAAIPEPGTIALAAAGALPLLGLVRRRRAR